MKMVDYAVRDGCEMFQKKSPRRKTIASRLRGIAGVQVAICALLFLLMAINQPFQSYRHYEQNTAQSAALFSAIAADSVSTLEDASKYAGQILNSAAEKTFIGEALAQEKPIQSDLIFCRELYKHSKALTDQLGFLDKVAVFDLEGNAVYVSRDRNSYYLTKTPAESAWFQKVVAARGGAVILAPDDAGSDLPPIFQDDLVIARAVFDPLKLRAEGIYLLTIARDTMEAAFDTYRVGAQQAYALVYHNEVLLSRFSDAFPIPQEMPLRELVSDVVREDGLQQLYSYYRFSSDSYLVIRTPLSAVLSEIIQINVALLTAAFLVLCLFVFIIWRLLNDILHPLQSLTGALDATTGSFFPTIGQSDLPADLEPLFNAYNRMSVRIDHLINEGLRKDVANREIELQLLRTQINPHYLYNTLECIHMRAYVNHDYEVARMAELLGGNLQYGLRQTNAKVPLHTEFEKAGEYMTLVGYHYGDRVKLISHLDDSIRDCMVIKLLLQPLIENAIQHGLTPERPLTIEVLGYPHGMDSLCLQVSDDGEGMTAEACEDLMNRLEAESGEDAIGLRNVHRRLRLRYGDRYGVQIRSIPQQSTVVTLTLPLEYGKEET